MLVGLQVLLGPGKTSHGPFLFRLTFNKGIFFFFKYDLYVWWLICIFARNRKLFPVVATYFTIQGGVQHQILDFYEDDHEASDAITQQLLNVLETRNLPLAAVTSYSADNAAVNYGKNKSVYQKLNDKCPGIL